MTWPWITGSLLCSALMYEFGRLDGYRKAWAAAEKHHRAEAVRRRRPATPAPFTASLAGRQSPASTTTPIRWKEHPSCL